jgi:rubrerythrin
MNKDINKVEKKKSRKFIYIETLKKLRDDTLREIFTMWKEIYNPLYDPKIIKRTVLKALDVSSTHYHDALRFYKNEVEEIKNDKIKQLKEQGYDI